MNILEAVRDFIKGCPYLPEYYDAIGVDYLNEAPEAYMIESTAVAPIVKRYVTGDCVKQLAFVFSSREHYGEDARQNLNSIGFYQDFAEWLEECTRAKNLPVLDEKREAMSIEATTTGYVFDTGPHEARYQIQCRLVYFEKGDF
jgi:hypothetical protein